MLRTRGLLKKLQRRSLGSTLLVLLGLSVWQYIDQGRITWHYALVNQLEQSTGLPITDTRADPDRANTQSTPAGTVLVGRVVEIKDGDTFVLDGPGTDNYTIRLYGIDTPEWDQPYGKKSSGALARLIDGREVSVTAGDTDDYGRIVGRVFYGEEDINLSMVRDGHAWWYKQYAKKNSELEQAESLARQSRTGLWSQPDPIAPWMWRRRH